MFEEVWGLDATAAISVVFDFINKRRGSMTYADVEDLTQETMVKALHYCSQPNREPVRCGVALLKTMAGRVITDFWRRTIRLDKRRQLIDEFNDLHHRRAAASTQHVDWVARLRREQEYIDVIESLIDKLRPKARSIMRLLWDPVEFDFKGLTHNEVAELLGIPRVTVTKTYNRCIEGWRDRLGDFEAQLRQRTE
ncbi:RNA polymerase sigma factor [Mycobacterium asiaticum]|uniref:RNA polymerase sigma factor n=1 Tax=Mycobacterium asiaticum TaxID=1790 RepID=UPI001302026B|nr:sigma-70 family RNA polymerase sigma factor [Mycobacterium asiaticum]